MPIGKVGALYALANLVKQFGGGLGGEIFPYDLLQRFRLYLGNDEIILNKLLFVSGNGSREKLLKIKNVYAVIPEYLCKTVCGKSGAGIRLCRTDR